MNRIDYIDCFLGDDEQSNLQEHHVERSTHRGSHGHGHGGPHGHCLCLNGRPGPLVFKAASLRDIIKQSASKSYSFKVLIFQRCRTASFWMLQSTSELFTGIDCGKGGLDSGCMVHGFTPQHEAASVVAHCPGRGVIHCRCSIAHQAQQAPSSRS